MLKKYHIITYGCQMNKSDSERIASLLESSGYKKASKIEEADLIVVNMCSVRQSAVDRVYGLFQSQIAKLTSQNHNSKLKTVLTGCVLKKDRKKFKEHFDYILDIKDIKELLKRLQKLQSVAPVRQTKNNSQSYLGIKPKYSDNSFAFVPISNGCNNFCAYCVVPYVRGKETCRPADEILCEVKNLVKRGYREIWLLGQNVNSYKSQIPMTNDHSNPKSQTSKLKLITFSKLLKMVNDIPGHFSIRFTSPHPKDFSDELIDTMTECKKVAKYLNLPVQSGDNKILKKMNRNYTIEDYKKLVKKIRKKIPNINLSTDVIVGFPGETKKQFENTAKLFKEIKFDTAYIAKYSPRPGTAAAKMKDNISIQEKKRREKILREILIQN